MKNFLFLLMILFPVVAHAQVISANGFECDKESNGIVSCFGKFPQLEKQRYTLGCTGHYYCLVSAMDFNADALKATLYIYDSMTGCLTVRHSTPKNNKYPKTVKDVKIEEDVYDRIGQVHRFEGEGTKKVAGCDSSKFFSR